MILDKIVAAAKTRVLNKKNGLSFDEMKVQALNKEIKLDFPFEKALKGDNLSFICEVKKASPSKGIIAKEFPYLQIAREYEMAGAKAISVLTEPDFFMGADEYLLEISKAVNIPVLRKDFVIDSYQIYEAVLLEASAILLISELLDEDTLHEYIEIADGLGLSALVESHSLPQMNKALRAGARVIGVNNRNLDTFEVDLNTSIRLREHVPADKIFVSESGISTAEDIKALREHHVNAVLIGETLMRSENKKKALEDLGGSI